MFKITVGSTSFLLWLYRACAWSLAKFAGKKDGFKDPSDLCSLFWVIVGGLGTYLLWGLMAIAVGVALAVAVAGAGTNLWHWLVAFFAGDPKAMHQLLIFGLVVVGFIVVVCVVIGVIFTLSYISDQLMYARWRRERLEGPKARKPRKVQKPQETSPFWRVVAETYRGFKEKTCVLVEIVEVA